MQRFMLRDLFWLVLVIALALGWWVDHREARQRFDDAAADFALEKRSMESMLRIYQWHYRPSRAGLVHERERVPPDPAIFGESPPSP